jgi:hypothetical protein
MTGQQTSHNPEVAASNPAPYPKGPQSAGLFSLSSHHPMQPFDLADATHLLHAQTPRGMAEALAAFYGRFPACARLRSSRSK